MDTFMDVTPECKLSNSMHLMTPPGGSACASPVPERSAVTKELTLIQDDKFNITDIGPADTHQIRTAPLLTRNAYIKAQYQERNFQYGVLGKVLTMESLAGIDNPYDSLLYLNTNAPFSAVVCGVQGSGKSHTVSVILENMFVPNFQDIGSLEKGLCGLVLHFGEGGPSSRPCEAAWLGVPAIPGVACPPVQVFVSKSSLNTMKTVYAPLGSQVSVEPLLFTEAELDAEAFLSMMAVGSSDSAPLYIQVILSILRDLGENFTYRDFIAELDERKRTFNPAQIAGLEQRMALLTSFMVKGVKRGSPRFAPGQLTIVDLSDTFIDAASACGLFEIITRLFVRADVDTGKVLLVDEAHKYLSAQKGNSGLTKSLLTLIREQRHLGMRVLISTQEPTVIPAIILDLCTVAILHRFSSPSWWKHLINHVSAEVSSDEAFDKVVKLQTGEAIVLAPSGLGMFHNNAVYSMSDSALKTFGRRYMVMRTRKRATTDGGASVLVLNGL